MRVHVILTLCLVVVAYASKDCSYAGLGHEGLNLNEVKDVFQSTADACAEECKKDLKCAGSTHDGGQYCWLHSNVVSERFKTCDGCTLFTKSCISEGCVYPKFGHNGNNLGDGFPATTEECRFRCRAEGQCVASTRNDANGHCWLHSHLEGSKWESAPGSVFVKDCNPSATGCTMATLGHQGNDLPNPMIRTAEQCAADCRAHPGCVGATHDKHGGCYMHFKLEFSRYKTCDGCSLFAKDCSDGKAQGCVHAKYGHNGNNLGSPFQASAETCKLKCLSDPACEGSTFDEHNWCWLHEKLESSRIEEHDGRTLFVKECHGCTKQGFSHAGNDLGAYYAAPDLCAKMCRDRPDCFGATHDTNKICWLHSKIETGRIQIRDEDGWTLFNKKC